MLANNLPSWLTKLAFTVSLLESLNLCFIVLIFVGSDSLPWFNFERLPVFGREAPAFSALA